MRKMSNVGGKGGGGGSGGGGGGSKSCGGGSSGGGGGCGTGGGSGGSGGGGGGSGGSGGGGGSGTGGGGTGARRVGSGGGQRQIAIFDLDFDAILSAMYALSVSAEGDCYRCVPPDPGIAAAALGASESGTLPGTALAQALHTFMLDSGASACFFRDSTTLIPLSTPVPFRLVNPSGGPVVARYSTVLPCPAIPSGSLSGLHLPSFSANLVSTAALQDAMVTTTKPGGSSLYTLATEPPQIAASSQVSASGLPRSLPPLAPSPALPCLPCVEGRQRAAPHSSLFPPMTAPLQTLHMDVLGPTRVSGQSRECYFLLVVDDYTRYTTVFPLRSKGEVVDVLIPWIRTVRLQLRERFGQDLPVLRLHSDRGRRIGLVMEVARTSMIHAAAPHFLWPFAVRYAVHQLNIWLRVSLPETSPTLRWTGEVGDASFYHPTLRRVFPSLDVTFNKSIPFYRLFPYRSAPPPPPPLFLAPGPPPVYPLLPQDPAPSCVSQVDPLLCPAPVEVALGSGAARGAASGGAASGGAEPGGVESEGAGSGGAEPGGAELVGEEPEGADPGGAESEGAESGGAKPWGAAFSGGPAGASPRLSPQQLREWFVWRARLWSGATGAGGAGDAGAGGAGVTVGAGGTGGTAATGTGGAHTRGTGAARIGGVEGAGAGDTGAGGAGAGGAGAAGVGAGGAGDIVRPRPYFVPLLHQVLGVLSSTGLTPPLLCPPPDQSQLPFQPASPLLAPSLYTEQSGGLTERREPASRPVLPVCTARRVPRWRPPPVPGTHAMALRPSSVPLRVPLPAPPVSSLLEVPDIEFDRARAASPIVARLFAIAVTDPSFEPAAASALVTELFDFAATCRLDYATALVAESASASPPSIRDIPTPRSYAEAITSPYSSQWQAAMDGEMTSWKSTGTYVDEVPPPGANIVNDMWIFRVKRPPGPPPAFKARYVARGFSQRQGVDYFQTFSPTPKMTTLRVLLHVAAQRDYELHSLDFSTAFLQGSLHEEIWLRRPHGFTDSFHAGTQWSLRRPVYGLRQAPREWHDILRTTLAALGFAPATAEPSLFLRTNTWLPPFYVLVYVDDLVFATADTEALTLLNSELQKRQTCTDPGELYSYLGLHIIRDRARRTITLTQLHMVHQVLQRFGFQFSSPQPTPLSTSHSLSAPPSDEFVELSGPYPELVGCLMYLMTCTRPDLAYPLSLLARYVAPGRHRKSTRSSSVLSSRCKAEIYAEAMAAQELCWLTYLLTDLGEQPCWPPVLYVDNKAMIALCHEHRLEHRTNHITLRYFLARDLQQRGQLRLAYVATRANTADIFTKALPSVEDLVTHLRTSVARYRTAFPAEYLDRNPPLMYITLYFIVAHLPDSLRAVRDHFLALDPTDLTVDLLEKHVLAAETSIVAVGAARGTPRRPFFEGCSPSPLAPSYASAAAVDILGTEDVGTASAISGKCRSSKGKGGKSGGGGSGGGGGGGGGGGEGGGSGGSGGGSGGFGGGGGGSGGGGGGTGGGSESGGGGSGGGRGGAAQRGGSGGGQRQQQRGRSETPTPQHLREWFAQRGASGGSVRCPYIIRTGDRAGQTCGKSGVDIFSLDYDAILAAMYALYVSAEGDYYLCVPPDPCIEAAALGARESALLDTALAEALDTFTLDSRSSRCFFRDSTTLTPLPAPAPIRLADPSVGLVLARSSTDLVCLGVPSGSLSGLHLPSFSTNLVSASGPVAAPCSCRLMSHQTLLWQHRLGHPSLPRLRGMHSHLLVSGLPRSLPPLPPSLAPPCLPCIEGWQRAAPHSSLFSPTSAPLQTLHMDVWSPARVSGHNRERYFLLVVDDYTRYTMVFPFRCKGEVPDVLIPWIRAVRLQLGERFREDLLVLRLHYERGGEFSYDLLRDFCHGEGILQSFMLPASPQENGIAECRIGLVMELRVSLPETSPTLRWTGKVGDALVFRVWGSRAFVRDTSADMLSSCAIPCVFLGFPLDVPGWQFCHPTSRRVIPSQDVTFDESVPFYCLFPYRTVPLPPPAALPRSGAARGAASGGAASGGAEPEGAEPGGAEPEGAEPGGAQSEGVESGGAETRGTASAGGPAGSSPLLSHRREPLSLHQLREWFAQRTRLRSGAAGAGGSAAGGTRAKGAGATSLGGARVIAGAGGTRVAGAAGPGGACVSGTGAAGAGGVGGAGAGDPGAGGAGAGGTGGGGAEATSLGGAGVTAGARGTGGASAARPGGARTRGSRAAGAGGVGGTGAGDTGAGGTGTGGAGARGAGAGGAGAGDPGAGGAGAGRTSTGGAGAGCTGAGYPGAGGAGAGGARAGGTGAGGTVQRCHYSFRRCRRLCRHLTRSFARFLLQPDSPLPALSPYAEQTDSLTECREPESRPALPVCTVHTGRRVPRPRPQPVLGTHIMPLRPSSVPLRVSLPPPSASSLPAVPDPESDLACAASPTVPRLLATVVTDPSFESTVASALVAELVDFAAACCLDYATSLVAESDSDCHPSVGCECAIGTDVLEDRQEEFECLAAAVPHLMAMLLALEGGSDAPDIPTPRSYAEALTVPPSSANIVDGMWIFRVKRPLGSPPTFKARYSLQRPVYDLRQALCEWHNTLRTTLAALGFAPLTADPSLFLRTDTLLLPFYVLVYVLQRFGFRYSSPQSTPQPTGHSLSAPPSNESIEPSGLYPKLVGCLVYLMTCIRHDIAYHLSILARYVAPGSHRPEHWEAAKRVLRYLCNTSGMGLGLGGRGPVVLNGHADASWVDDLATQRSSQGYTFSLGSGSVSWRSTRSSSVLSSSCEAEIYVGAMAAQELCWLTYLLTDLGERPRSPPVLYVDNKAMIALCQEHRLEHRTKHIALRYFLG
ncbi:unnamed protein product [Closterium sp. NIES-53]